MSPGDNSRFGWHNLRHSLATFLGGANVNPSVIQKMLRQAKPQTTARYIHSVKDRQLEAQGLFLKAIKQGKERKVVRVKIEIGLNLG